MSGSGLPKRRAQGYKITAILWEVTANARVAEGITDNVRLPPPFRQNINEIKLDELLRQLANLATQGLQILARYESAEERASYSSAQHERVEIHVLSGGRLLGRVNGTGQIFNERGHTISPGVPPSVVTDPRRHRGRPKSGK